MKLILKKSLKSLAFFASCTTEANDVETEVLALFEVLAAEAPAALAELDTAVLAAVALYNPPNMLNKPPFIAIIFTILT